MVLLGRRIGPRIWLSCSLFSWGILSMAHAGIQNSGTLIALRLLLGAAESGFTQTAFYYMSTMYPKFSLGFRMGMFSGMYSIAGAFAGLIAYGLLQVKSEALKGWQVVFLVEGGITVFMAIVGWFVFPADISTAWFLNTREREHAVMRMGRDLAGGQEEEEEGKSRMAELKKDVVDVLKDWKKLLTIVCNITAVVVSFFNTPDIGMGLTDAAGHRFHDVFASDRARNGVYGHRCDADVGSSVHRRHRGIDHLRVVVGLLPREVSSYGCWHGVGCCWMCSHGRL
jgi:MFS family permease